MRLHPVIWFSVLALCGWVLWTVSDREHDAGDAQLVLQDGSVTDAQLNLSDRDNAAEEVRAVATRISNIEQAMEHHAQVNQLERERLRAAIRSDMERMALTEDPSGQQETVSNISNALDALTARLDSLAGQSEVALSETTDSPYGGEELYWISSRDVDFAKLPYDTFAAGTSSVQQELLSEYASQAQATHASYIPHLTIPATTTLLNATALTALVGRIPVRGQLQDPWRFKVIVGAKNLASNGHRIPQLAGMLLAGTARGDLSLSCVSGNIDTATFIFQDGTIQSARKTPQPEAAFAGLGWISDELGNPCIAGELKSNALQYLTQATLINTTRATAEAIANAQTETTTTANTGERVTSIVGDLDQFVAGYATKESLSTVAQWLNDRQLDTFDAIYVPAGHRVAIHIEEAIHIDQVPGARKVKRLNSVTYHANARQGWID